MKFKELAIALTIGLFVLLLSNLPILLGVLLPKDNLYFLGRLPINSQDLYTYVSFIEQGKNGSILFENLYRSEPQAANLIRPSYIGIGMLANVFHAPSIVAYHAARIFLTIIFMITLYAFLRFFFDTSKKRLVAFFITLTSMGVGYLVGAFFNSTDLWIPESVIFLSLSEAPHFILSQIYMLLIFSFVLLGVVRKRFSYFLFAAAVCILLTFEHPFNLVVIMSSLVLLGAWQYKERAISKREIVGLGIIILFCGLGLLYQYIETVRNATLTSWAGQSDLSSPIPFYYILGFGFMVPFMLIGFEKFLSSRTLEKHMILSWIIAVLVLLYAPVFFQRRFTEGMHIPLSILTAVGVFTAASYVTRFFVKKLQGVFENVFIFACALLLSFGAFGTVWSAIYTIQSESQDAYYYYILNAEKEGMEWVRDNTAQQDLILTNWFYGNVLPGIAGRKVYVGHKIQTPEFDSKIEKINSFLLEKDPEKAVKFLKDNNISYIYLGNNDTMLQYGFEPSKKAYLIKEFDRGGVTVWRVR